MDHEYDCLLASYLMTPVTINNVINVDKNYNKIGLYSLHKKCSRNVIAFTDGKAFFVSMYELIT